MKKKPIKKKAVRRASELDATGALDWAPLFAAFREAFEWALDVAAALARDFPEEVEAVERVRRFMRARITGEEAHVRVDDVLFTFGLIIGAIERDLGPIGVRAPWFAMPMQLPTASEFWEPWVPRHFASDLWIHTAPVQARA
ncbi:MAG: hypothetical protein KF773_12280 [Deltaproteobacteria bacterium]|nr:hypothetical protein [Deltaproteobacteria bacterium]